MDKPNKFLKRRVHVKVHEVRDEGLDVDNPHIVGYSSEYVRFDHDGEGGIARSTRKADGPPPVREFMEVLANSTASAILDTAASEEEAVKLAVEMSRKLISNVARRYGVGFVDISSMVPNYDEGMGDLPPREKTQTLDDFRDADLTQEQQDALRLSLQSPHYSKLKKN